MGLLNKIFLEIETLIKQLMGIYPLSNYQFRVEIDGLQSTNFSEILGLAIEYAVIEHRDGSSKVASTKIPGLIKYNNIILKRPVQKDNHEFFDWVNSVQLNQNFRKNLTISLLNEEHNPIASWKVVNAWPCKYVVGSFNATSNEVLIETIELTHEGLALNT
jgi:phage tail-like protein